MANFHSVHVIVRMKLVLLSLARKNPTRATSDYIFLSCPITLPQASQYGQTSTSSSSLAPNMTTSLIQDYVPRDERHSTAGVEMNHTKLASTPEDGVSGIGCYDSGQRQHARVLGSEAFAEGSTPEQHPAVAAAAAAAADMMHWPSPEQGHGYAERRVYKQLVGQGGPAPFLTPGPHRGRMLG